MFIWLHVMQLQSTFLKIERFDAVLLKSIFEASYQTASSEVSAESSLSPKVKVWTDFQEENVPRKAIKTNFLTNYVKGPGYKTFTF